MTESELIPLARAKAEGLTHYFTGRPCSKGHVALRFTSARKCVACQVAQSKESAAKPAALARKRQYRQLNPLSSEARAAEVERARQWRLANQERDREWRRHYAKRKKVEDPCWALARALRNRLSSLLRQKGINKSAGAYRLVGCSLAELKAHLERQFTGGMNWSNYGEWHIDHIRPCASFDLTQEGQQKICFHWTNLQPLWAEENLQKHAKWPHD